MEFAPDTPTGQFVIQGITLSIPKPFAEGQVLKANEASVLNQTLAENIRNNLADKVGKAEEELKAKGADDEAVRKACQELVNGYLAVYSFGVRRAGGRSVDPVEREAYSLAEEQVKAAIRQMGHKITAYKDMLSDLVEQALADNPGFMKEAKAIVDRRKKATQGVINLKLVPKEPEAAE